MDKQEYRKRVLLGLCTRPRTLLPLVGGASLMIGAWAVVPGAGILPFAGLLGVLTGVGTFLSSAFTGGGNVADKVVEAMRKEGEASREQALDDLERRLGKDGDPRTERALQDLRRLAGILQQDDAFASQFAAGIGFDVLSDVSRLFQTSVGYLEKTLEIWGAAQEIDQPGLRKTLRDQREQLIQEVQGGVEHLGEVLGQLQGMSGNGSGSALQRLRKELDQNLEIARRVDARMAEWGASYEPMEPTPDPEAQE